MKLVEINDGIYKFFTTQVKGNNGLNYETAQKKITRDIRLAKMTRLGKNKKLYIYGYLMFLVENNKVLWMTSMKRDKDSNNTWFQRNEDKYNKLNIKLGLV
jgi:hypothetical protein